MALRHILTDEDAQLRKRSREVKEITPHIRELIEDMWDTMYAANGVGFAAPQFGVLRRVVVIDATPPEDAAECAEDAAAEEEQERAEDAAAEEGPERAENVTDENKEPLAPQKYVLINPEILYASQETVSEKEGCLSVPGRIGTVERPVRVRVRAQNEDGEIFEIEGDGLLAKALSHEIDHLEGILFTDLATEIEEFSAADGITEE